MAVVALVLYVVFGALGFGWRSWHHHRRTGSTGFRGISGRVGSVEWFAGVGFAVSVATGMSAPVLQVAGVVSPVDELDVLWLNAVGAVIAMAGVVATVYAQVDMGDSWRIGVDSEETTELMRGGVFGVVRNPIFAAMGAFAGGVVLMIPNVVALIGFVMLVLALELQVRVVEEPYLGRTHGAAYREYAGAVGRFVPEVGRM